MGIKRLGVTLWTCILIIFILPNHIIFAHSPHDVIQSFAVAAGSGHSLELFVIVQGKLRKSADGGITWTQLAKGLDYRHSLQQVVASPSYHADHTLCLSTKGSGVYCSTDRGSSWRNVNVGLEQLRIGLLAISPHDAGGQMVLAAGLDGGLYQSDSRSWRWRQIRDQSANITAIHFPTDAEGREIFIGDRRGRLHRSTDGGKTWELYAEVNKSGGITAIVSAPGAAGERMVLCGAARRGIVKVTQGGGNLVDASRGILDKYITSIALSPAYARDAAIFVSTWFDGVYHSADNGRNWRKLSVGLTTDLQADMMKKPYFTALHPSPHFAEDRTLFLAGFDGLFQSNDGAATWRPLEADALGRIEGIALSPQHHSDHTIAFATYRLGAFLSEDGGQTWRSVRKGMDSRLADIAFSPQYASDRTVFATSTDYFYKSTAPTTAWERLELPSRDWKSIIDSAKNRLFKSRPSLSGVVARQVQTAGVWDAFGAVGGLRRAWRGLRRYVGLLRHLVTKRWTVRARDILASPNFATDQTLYVSSANNRLFRSADGGRTWSVIWRGRNKPTMAVALSPAFPTDRTLFLSTSTDGLRKSVDGGDTWRIMRRAKRGNKGLKIALSPAYATDQTLLISSADGLLRSRDGGASWTALDYPRQSATSPIVAMAFSPTYEEDGLILISVQGGGLFRYDGKRDAFTPTGAQLLDSHYVLTDIVFSPTFALDNTVYGASEEALLRSTDGGKTWRLVKTPVHPKRALLQETAGGATHREGDKT